MDSLQKKLLRACIALSSLFAFTIASAREIVMISADGSKTKTELGEIQRFETNLKNGTLTANYKNGKRTADLRCIVFNGGLDTSSITKMIETDALSLYPNPVSETLHISGAGEKPVSEVINTSGAVEIRTMGTDIDVSALAPGMYIIRIGRQYARFIKK